MDLTKGFKLSGMILAIALSCSACQVLVPKAQGLIAPNWVAQSYQRQDQIEVEWNKHSFSFLLYQQQQANQLEMIALSLTGQQLFKLSFDGQKVDVQQRIDQMKYLPFEYVVRDILYATYPNFAALQNEKVHVEKQDSSEKVYIQQQVVLEISHRSDTIELNNVQVPYQMVISAMSDSLENDEDLDAQ